MLKYLPVIIYVIRDPLVQANWNVELRTSFERSGTRAVRG
jgi:hypothetical protein